MSSEQEEVKARMMKEAERVIEEILAGKKPAGQNSLSEIERLAIHGGRAFEEMVTQALAEEESEAEEQPVCETCRVGMRSVGRRKRSVVTEAGEVRIERSYYVCPKCGRRTFSPG